MAKSPKYSTIEEYINYQSSEAQVLLRDLKSIILEVAPQATELFNYGVPAFELIEGGKLDAQILIAGFKKHVGLYPQPTTIEHFADELKVYKQGKGSIQFPFGSEIPKDLVRRMIKFRMEQLMAK